jgi:hypothetical protein
MSSYNPQRGRGRPVPSSTEPAPVDVILEHHPVAPDLPEGVEIEVTRGGEMIIHTADADVEITPAGDDVIVRTADSTVEVLAEADAVIVDAAGEEILIDTAPQMPRRAPSFTGSPIVSSPAKPGKSKLVIALAAAVAAVAAVLIWQRRRR